VRQGLILWDLQLFFEVHEVLEHAWHGAEGGRRRLLQALIRAAGVYIKLEFGQSRQAAGLAEKACAGLEENRDALREYFAPEELIAALRSLNPTPPALLSGSPSAGCAD
jgi:predicted metal-dependent hydrolase